MNYKKKENDYSILNIEGVYKKNKSTNFKNILFQESENKILINDLNLSNNFKFIDVNKIDLNFINKNKKQNKIIFKKKKNNYKILGKSFDGCIFIDKMLYGDEQGSFSNYLNNFNSVLEIDVDQIYTDNVFYLNNFGGILEFKDNKIVFLYKSGH